MNKSRFLVGLIILTMLFTIVPVVPAQADIPTITSVIPEVVPAAGGEITITGTNLDGTGTKVILGIGSEVLIIPDDDGSIITQSPNMLVVKVPSHAVDSNGIKQVDTLVVYRSTESSDIYHNPFKYVAPPTITNAYPFTVVEKYDEDGNPSNDPADKKIYLKIEGSYTSAITSVYLKKKDKVSGYDYAFGHVEGATGQIYYDASDAGVYIDITDLLVGSEVAIKVDNEYGSNSADIPANWFEATNWNIPVPYVNMFNPRPDPILAGQSLVITGNNLGDIDHTEVWVAGSKATLNSVSSNEIRLTIPIPQPGSQDLKIQITNAGNKIQGVAIYRKAVNVVYTYPSPAIESISPSWGTNAAEREVIITGTNIRTGATVTFDGVSARVIDITTDLLDPAKITMRVAAPASSKRGPVPVVLTNIDGESASTTYTYTSSPQISKVSPNIGPTDGGNYINIEGSQFMRGSVVVIGHKMVGMDEDSLATMDVLLTDIAEEVFGDGSYEVDPANSTLRVLGPGGTDLPDYDVNPNGTRLILEVPSSADAGPTDIYVINPDRGWTVIDDGYLYTNATSEGIVFRVQPNEGDVKGGQEITISAQGGGSFLDEAYDPAQNYGVIVTIDGIPAAIKSITDANQVITVTTPPGTRVGQWVPVQVMNITPSTYRLDVLEEGFLYHRITTLPVITNFTPKHGEGGTVVTITGRDFVVDNENTHVLFGDHELVQDTGGVVVIDSMTISFPVPTGLSAGLYTIKVKNPDSGTATAPDEFNYQIPYSHPQINDIAPEEGTVAGGNYITITGSDFRDNLEVYIGGRAAANIQLQKLHYDADLEVWDECVIICQTPAAPGGLPATADVMVLNPDGGMDVAEDAYTYISVQSFPVITSVQPNQGSTNGGQLVTLTGSNFLTAPGPEGTTLWPTVTFGGVPATILQDDTLGQSQNTKLKVYTPARVGGGRVDVSITNPLPVYGTFTLPNAYTYNASQPSITEIVPDTNANKNAPTYKLIKGVQFVPPAYSGAERTRIYLRYPAGSEDFQYEIEITDGTTDVPINDTTSVTFNNVEIFDSTLMGVVLPQLPDAYPVGEWSLVLVNPDGGTASKTITYVSINPAFLPRIDSIDPNKGPSEGGTLVTITGSNFKSGVKVYLNSILVTEVTRSDDGTQLIIETPPDDAPSVTGHSVDLLIANPDGTSVGYPDAFTYIQVVNGPVIDKIEPTQGPTKGGTVVTITGSNFADGVKVFFDTTELDLAEGFTPTVTTIRIVTPAHDPGPVDVIVRNPDYSEAKVEGGFTYTGAPGPQVGTFTAEIVGESAIKLSWSEVPGAAEYEVSVSVGDRDHWTHLISTTETTYLLKQVKADTSYYFRLRTVNAEGASVSIDADPFPLHVDASDIADQPATGTIDEMGNLITGSGSQLRIVLGRELLFTRSALYQVSLDQQQRRSTGVEVLIPAYCIDKAWDKTVLIETDNYKAYIPLRALNTFEYQKYKQVTDDTYVSLRLKPISQREMEAVSLNSSQHAVGGFALDAALSSAHRQNTLTYFASALSVYWPPGTDLGEPRVYQYDAAANRWVNASGTRDFFTNMFNVSVMKPDRFILFIPQTVR